LDIAATANAILTGEQILSGNALELGNIDNSVTFAGDIATEASGAIGLNMISGDFNLQKNAAVLALIADTTASETYADTSLLQSLFGQALGSVHMRNAVSVDLNATGDVAGNVGLNAASGAFNTRAMRSRSPRRLEACSRNPLPVWSSTHSRIVRHTKTSSTTWQRPSSG